MASETKAQRDADTLAWRVSETLDRYKKSRTGPALPAEAETLSQLYCADGQEFVILAYRTFLERDPSDTELAHNLQLLATGIPKGVIAATLRYSDEGVARPQRLNLGRERWLLRLEGVPLLGKLATALTTLAGIAGLKRSLLAQQQEVKRLAQELETLRACVRGLCADVIAGQQRTDHALRQETRSLGDRAARLEQSIEALNSGGRSDAAPSAEPIDDDFYLAFEEHFRGPEAEISDRLRYYLPVIDSGLVDELKKAPMVDIGCGRGEWLGLLNAAGYRATGVDLNARNVTACRSRGLTAEMGDGIQWLRSTPSDTLSLVSAFHVIEHLGATALNSFLVEALRCLRPGGMLIAETPNPENLVTAAHRFYTDPSHRHPLPPELSQFLLEYAGFTDVAIHRLHPAPQEHHFSGDDPQAAQLNRLLFGPQDYAVIGFKP